MSIEQGLRDMISLVLSGVIDEAVCLIKDADQIFTAGNGGSAATMSHLASDLCRLGLDAECLTDNVSRLTALTNDEGWGVVYRKMLEGRLGTGSLVVVASVNGSAGHSEAGEAWSANLYDLAVYTHECGGRVVGLIGNSGGQLKEVCDVALCLPSREPYSVEGAHSVLCHALCAKLKEEKA